MAEEIKYLPMQLRVRGKVDYLRGNEHSNDGIGLVRIEGGEQDRGMYTLVLGQVGITKGTLIPFSAPGSCPITELGNPNEGIGIVIINLHERDEFEKAAVGIVSQVCRKCPLRAGADGYGLESDHQKGIQQGCSLHMTGVFLLAAFPHLSMWHADLQ